VADNDTMVDSWVCPNDRQLALRAKLGAGWSMRTSEASCSVSRSGQLTADEQDHIMRVIHQAELVENAEMQRVGHLVERLENIRRNALGNGANQCLLCGEEFGLLCASPAYCEDCSKAVCNKCGVDTFNSQRQPIWLCKICSENRELWKRSGAWFYKGIPRHIRPPPKKPVDTSSIRFTSTEALARTGSVRSRQSQGPKSYSAWNRDSVRASSDQDSSDSDDEVMTNRRKAKPVESDTSSSVSH
jgi:hypothetical protein